ncbi:MAG: hypothetical protein ABI551_26405 [Polyangiaceae bacterium]
MRITLLASAWILTLFLFFACAPDEKATSFVYDVPDAAKPSTLPLTADAVELVEGVPDEDRDPSVVALRGAGRDCNGVLVAGDAVLTSSGCVGQIDTPPEQLGIRTGDPLSPPTAHGARVVLSEPIASVGAAFAVVLLDRSIVSSLPTWVRSTVPIPGEHLRTVGFEDCDQTTGKRLRDHLVVTNARLEAFAVSETPCGKQEGAAAFDEDSEELVGMVLSTASCTGPSVGTIYARVLPLRDFIEDALELSMDPDGGKTDAGKRLHGSKSKADTDFREGCEAGADCSTGVCIGQDGVSSCSRGCGAGDRCPTTTHCKRAVTANDGGVMVCADQ